MTGNCFSYDNKVYLKYDVWLPNGRPVLYFDGQQSFIDAGYMSATNLANFKLFSRSNSSYSYRSILTVYKDELLNIRTFIDPQSNHVAIRRNDTWIIGEIPYVADNDLSLLFGNIGWCKLAIRKS